MSTSMVMKHKRVTEYNEKEVSLVKRGVAFMVDWYISGVLISFPVLAVLQNENLDPVLELRSLPYDKAIVSCVMAVVVALIYLVVIPYKWNGQTLGKKIVGIKVVEQNKDKISLLALFKRQVLGLMLVEGSLISVTPLLWQVIFYETASYQQTLTWIYYGISILSAVLVVVTKNKKAIHDYISNTVVCVK